MASITKMEKVFILLMQLSLVMTQAFNPGNTFSNCIQAVTRASCTTYHRSRSAFRTIDGTCNNLRNPTAGSRNTAIRRLIKADYVDGFDTPRGFPGTKPIVQPPNKITEKLFNVEEQNIGTGDVSVLFMTFGQFLDHDLGLASHEATCRVKNCGSLNAFRYPCFPIQFEIGGSKCTSFARANPVCQQHLKRKLRKPRDQINALTAFVDGSQIYGSDFRRNQMLRNLDGTGTLKLTKKNLLQLDEERLPCSIRGGCSLVAELRGDENIALHSMHTMWLREHNRIAKQLKVINPTWNEEDLFQNTRKIVGGMLQHIVFNEWLPSVTRMKSYSGYNRRTNPSIVNAFSVAAFRFGHSLIPNKFAMLDKNFNKLFEPVTLQNASRNRRPVDAMGIETIMFGLVGNNSNEIDQGFASGIARKLFVKPGESGRMDLTAFNIQRGRDHGIPTYGKYRRFCKLRAIKNFEQLKKYMIPGTVEAFKKLYTSPNDIDLFAAGICEKHVPGLLVGPTFECIIRNQFTRLRDGDRFFYRSNGVFERKQFEEIRRATIARVMCNNLKGIVSIQPQAFKTERALKNKRIACTRIPKLDLSAWKDTKIDDNDDDDDEDDDDDDDDDDDNGRRPVRQRSVRQRSVRRWRLR